MPLPKGEFNLPPGVTQRMLDARITPERPHHPDPSRRRCQCGHSLVRHPFWWWWLADRRPTPCGVYGCRCAAFTDMMEDAHAHP